MIILITGASHTGKTLLAQKLLEKYQYPYLSIDLLKMGLIRSGCTSLTPYDDDELTAYLWNICKEIIKTAVENHQNLIVEGCYIPFDWKKDFSPKYLDHIRYCCLVMSENYLKHYRLKSVGFGAKAPIIATESRCQSKDLFARLKVCLSSTQVAVIPLP